MQALDLAPYLKKITLPTPSSVKGDNGRVLVIGGSELFHAASFWSATIVSRLIDMVHFSSPAIENNKLMRIKAKEKFWDGIVVPWEKLDHYIAEDDCILIGPGMTRGIETREITNHLLKKYPEKKWVVDGGALQEVDPSLLTQSMIITPNIKELARLPTTLPCTILAKGPTDTISQGLRSLTITGGNPGMTKGGTGDVLAGLLAGLYAKSEAFPSCVIASYTNKMASEELEKTLNHFFSPNDLITQIPKSLNLLFTIVVKSSLSLQTTALHPPLPSSQ